MYIHNNKIVITLKKFLRKFGLKISKINDYPSPSSMDILKKIFPHEKKFVIFDVGAHEGQSASKYNFEFPNAPIYSFEPFRDAYNKIIEKNIPNVIALNMGLSNEKGSQKFYINLGSQTNSLLELGQDAKEIWGGFSGLTADKEVLCEFNTIDNFMLEEKIDQIDFLKLDVQGAEYKVLQGARNALENKKIKLIQLEALIGEQYVGQKTIAYYVQELADFDYKLKNISDIAVVNDNITQIDLIFEVCD
jgi:FkbM family methyltransferase